MSRSVGKDFNTRFEAVQQRQVESGSEFVWHAMKSAYENERSSNSAVKDHIKDIKYILQLTVESERRFGGAISEDVSCENKDRLTKV